MALRQWELCGQPKITLRINDEAEMVRGVSAGEAGAHAVVLSLSELQPQDAVLS